MTKKIFISDLSNSVLGQLVYLAVVFVGGVLITRLLTPQDMGIFAIASLINSFAITISEAGLGGFLIRDREVSELKFNTVFTVNLFIGILLFLIIIATSPLIDSYFLEYEIRKIIIISSSVIIINSISVTQISRLFINESYFKYYFLRIISSFLGYSFGIYFALSGYAVFSLIYSQIIIAILFFILTLFYVNSSFRFAVSKDYLFKIKYFAFNTTISNIINSASNIIGTSLLAKYFSFSTVGNYDVSKKTAEVPTNGILSVCQNLFYPKLSKLQNFKSKFSEYYFAVNSIISIISLLFFITISIFSEVLIEFLYGEKYIQASDYFRLIMIYCLLLIFQIFPRITLKVFDQTKFILFQEFLKKIVFFLGIYISVLYNNFNVFLLFMVMAEVFGHIYFISIIYMNKKIPLFKFKIDLYLIFAVIFYLILLNLELNENIFYFLLFFSILTLLIISTNEGVFKSNNLRKLLR